MKLERNNYNKKNMKGLMLVGILLLSVGGVSFAYFISRVLQSGTGSSTSVTTATIKGATLKVEGTLEFNDLDILPGHQNISSVKVTATGNNELIPYNLIWNGTNTLNTPLNYKVYKTSEQVSVTSSCNKETKVIDGVQQLSEECIISNLDKLGTEISSGTISKSETESKITLVKDEFITAKTTGDTWYYYVILEYPNLDEPQNLDMGGVFRGKVTVEESNAKSDVNILAAYVIQDDGTYKEQDDIPQSGYQVNTEKSTCSNGATPTGVTPNITINNLSKSGTSCYLYFDIANAASTILANSGTIRETPDGFIGTATTDEGIFKTEDDDGTTYYFRGAVENNWIKFGDLYWRIIRINGDGTIRLIYNGRSNLISGISTQINEINYAYNTTVNDNMYEGFMYTNGQVHGTENQSTIKEVLDIWYKENIFDKDYSEKVDQNAGFCNDRQPSTDNKTSNGSGGIGGTTTYYGAYIRLISNYSSLATPTFKCKNDSDLFTILGANKGNKALTYPVGLITADEVVFAGSYWSKSNSNFYLYTGENYWTMSPYIYSGAAQMLRVSSNGHLSYIKVSDKVGIRPVINLKADTQFTFTGTGKKGSSTNPYVVK